MSENSKTNELLEIGRVVKPHGLKGDVIVSLASNRTERMEAGSHFSTERGTLEIARSSAHGDRWIVRFAGVDDRNGAEELRGTILLAEPIDDPDALWIHELIGSQVRLANGDEVGRVANILANPAGDIIETNNGVLIPLRFVTTHGKGFLVIDPPEGLLEVNQ